MSAETVTVKCPPPCGMVYQMKKDGGWKTCPVCGRRLHPSMAEKAKK